MTQEHTDSYGRALEMRQKRRQWEQERRERKAQQERDFKQRQLAAYLKRRGEDYINHTGEQPTLDDLATWRREYLGKIEAEYQAERAAKLAQAEENYR